MKSTSLFLRVTKLFFGMYLCILCGCNYDDIKQTYYDRIDLEDRYVRIEIIKSGNSNLLGMRIFSDAHKNKLGRYAEYTTTLADDDQPDQFTKSGSTKPVAGGFTKSIQETWNPDKWNREGEGYATIMLPYKVKNSSTWVLMLQSYSSSRAHRKDICILYDSLHQEIIKGIPVPKNITYVEPEAISEDVPIEDTDDDGRFTAFDARLIRLRISQPPQDIKIIMRQFDSNFTAIRLFSNHSLSIPLSSDLYGALMARANYSPELAASRLVDFDVNHDGRISWADDINLDGWVSKADYVQGCLLKDYMQARYSYVGIDEGYTASDILFGLNGAFGIYQKYIIKKSPLEAGFTPFEMTIKAMKDSTYNYQERRVHGYSQSGALTGSGVGAGIGFLAGNIPGLIIGGLLGGGIGGHTSHLERSHDQTTVQYYQYTKEESAPVNVAVFRSTVNPYIVFIFDASPTLTSSSSREIISHYNDNTLTVLSDSTVVQMWRNPVDHRTAGRVSVYDPERGIQCNFEDDALSGTVRSYSGEFNGFFVNNMRQVDSKETETYIIPFKKAKDNVLNGQLWHLRLIAQGMRTINKDESILLQNALLVNYDQKKQKEKEIRRLN